VLWHIACALACIASKCLGNPEIGHELEQQLRVKMAYGVRREDADLQIARWAHEQEVDTQPEPVQWQAQFQS
jgi:hypothetical protein